MEDFSRKIYQILEKSCDLSESQLIALSGGLDSSILAHYIKKRESKGIAIISEDFVSTDLTYCQIISKETKIPLTIYNVTTSEILEAVESTIKILKNFNDIEIRNNVVMYLAIKWAKENDYKSIITGDGADELFAGYNFLVNKPENELDSEIKRVCSIMHFPSQKIGEELKIKVESPFLDEELIKMANEIPSNLKIKEEKETRFGKWILRKTFENYLPSQIVWRKKSPMQDGAGTVGLTNLFESIINEEKFVEKKLTVKKDDDVVIRTRESMYYYEIFKKMYGTPVDKNAETQCPYCKHEVMDSKFCRMCGAFPI
ncbi:MAG: asparagine synthase C-terminal domain-containing protein [Nitrosopumilus sp.]